MNLEQKKIIDSQYFELVNLRNQTQNYFDFASGKVESLKSATDVSTDLREQALKLSSELKESELISSAFSAQINSLQVCSS
jgi:hypothetical protein